ncbi:MAG: M16 family metallopeptidase [Bacteroidota bacterium]
MLNRSVAPPFVEADQFQLPSYEKEKLANGIDLFLVRHVQQEVLKIEIMFRAGKWYEPRPSVSHFTAQLLEKGTTKKSSTAIAEAFDRLGAHVEITPGYDYASVSLYGLVKNWQQAFALLIEIVTQPSFPAEELDLQKSIFLQNLKVNLEKNSFVASQQIRKNIFGAKHPYGSSVEEEQVQALQADMLRSFHRDAYAPQAVFVTAGAGFDQTPLVQALAGWTNAHSPGNTASPEPALQKKQHLEKKDSMQTALRLARRSLLRQHADYPAALLFNHILGGYFGSRLMKNIREDKGLTYGIYSSLQPFAHDSMWVIGADVNKENSELAVREIRAELQRLVNEPVPPDELTTARNHFLGALQSEVANPFSVTDKIKNLYLHTLPANYYQELFDQLRKLNASDIMRVATTHFDAATLHEVTVG